MKHSGDGTYSECGFSSCTNKAHYGDYACMHFVGTGPEIAAAWAQMGAPGQIPEGWEWEPRAALEIYDEDFAVDPATGRFPCWLCIPVQRAR